MLLGNVQRRRFMGRQAGVKTRDQIKEASKSKTEDGRNLNAKNKQAKSQQDDGKQSLGKT